MKRTVFAGAAAVAAGLLPMIVLAAVGGQPDAHAGGAPHLDGTALGLVWAVPFAGILLSIAVFPLVAPHFWEHNFGKISAVWIAVVLLPFLVLFGWQLTLFEVLHLVLLEYLPFIILLLALFTVAGGIHFVGNVRGSPMSNTAFLAAGTAIASWTGTTGASMLLIRPVMRANKERKYKVHVIIFFIFLVSNIGGALTPLGDPPLFLGFLKGVRFFRPTVHVFLPMLLLAVALLAIFYVMDTLLFRREGGIPSATGEKTRIGINGLPNVALLGCVVAAVLMSGVWKPSIIFDVYHVEVELQNIIRDVLLLLITWVSWRFPTESIAGPTNSTGIRSSRWPSCSPASSSPSFR